MSPSDSPCRQAHIMPIETFDGILTDNRVITWDTTDRCGNDAIGRGDVDGFPHVGE